MVAIAIYSVCYLVYLEHWITVDGLIRFSWPLNGHQN